MSRRMFFGMVPAVHPMDQMEATPAKDQDEILDDGDEAGDGTSSDTKTFVGTVPESKELYAKFDKDKNRSWSHTPPDGLEEAAENNKTMKYAVLVRKMKPKEADSSKPLVIDSIVVQSPYLKRVLEKVFEGYPGIVTDVSRLIFSAPFECFVHRWETFAQAASDPTHDEDTRSHLRLFYGIMEDELKEIIQVRDDSFRNRAVAWDYAWTLFAPGCIVLTSVRDKPMAVRFEKGDYMETKECGKIYRMECSFVDWDGKNMGWGDSTQQIKLYTGTTRFTDLPCCPLEYTSDPDRIREVLVARGRAFESLAGNHYKYYEGVAAYHPVARPDKTRLEPVAGRIVIDCASWDRANPEHGVYLRPLHQAYEQNDRRHPRGFVPGMPHPFRAMRRQARIESQPFGESDDASRTPLTEDQLLLANPIVRGYSLKSKKWMKFFVDGVATIDFDVNAFDSLVLEPEQKKLILSFAQSQVKNKAFFDDLISGKGRGIIIMLSGGPGIGKTLTAESVAEEMRAPLYIMSAGDLGVHSDEVEDNLNNILRMVANWNAVLLLDECDIFLEQRTPQDLGRNKIVGIFLRMLEYYEGILFMTTNRVKNIDPAFNSRIHLSLSYPDLDVQARVTVWKTFLGKVSPTRKTAGQEEGHVITDNEIEQLSNLSLNGRQIKNVLKMASLLALQSDEVLKFEHVQSVLRIQGYSL